MCSEAAENPSVCLGPSLRLRKLSPEVFPEPASGSHRPKFSHTLIPVTPSRGNVGLPSRYHGAHLESQNSGGRGKRIASSRPAWATARRLLKQKQARWWRGSLCFLQFFDPVGLYFHAKSELILCGLWAPAILITLAVQCSAECLPDLPFRA